MDKQINLNILLNITVRIPEHVEVPDFLDCELQRDYSDLVLKTSDGSLLDIVHFETIGHQDL